MVERPVEAGEPPCAQKRTWVGTHEAWIEPVKDRRRISMQVACYGRRVGRGEGRSQADTGPGKRNPASGTARA